MMSFYPGQRVVCVWFPRTASGYGWEVMPVVGQTYTIRDVGDFDGKGVRLVEIVNECGNYSEGYAEVNFHPGRFQSVEELTETTAEAADIDIVR